MFKTITIITILVLKFSLCYSYDTNFYRTLFEYKSSHTFDQNGLFNTSSLINSINFYNLFIIDFYTCTKANIGKPFGVEIKNGKKYVYYSEEGNPLWSGLNKDGTWELSFILQSSIYLSSIFISDSIDNSKFLSWLISTTMNLIECYAIDSWNQPYNLKLNFNATIYYYSF